MGKKKKVIQVKDVKIGGNNPVVVKGMLKTSLANKDKLLKEAYALVKSGCQIIRVAIEKESDVKTIAFLKKHIRVPLEADIHFDYRLALLSIEEAIDVVRLNPLNIYRASHVIKVVRLADKHNIAIRVGVNSGGFRKRLSAGKLAETMCGKIISYIRIMEKQGFTKIMVSAKTSSYSSTLKVNRLLAEKVSYPIHIGLTATGPYEEGLIKSSVTLGKLLSEGIGNALRLSLNSDSAREVRVAKLILQSLGQANFYPQIISCPTCSRCKVDLRQKVEKFKEVLYRNKNGFYNKPISIALMGCVVNGPGEASSADVGIAFGKDYGVLFKGGSLIRRIPAKRYIEILKDFL